VVIITGGLAGAGATWWRAVTDAVQDEFNPAVRGCRILLSGIGPRAAILGAAAYADDHARLAVPSGTGAGR